MTIDRALSGNPFRIDQFRCSLAAMRLRGFRPRIRKEKWTSLPAKEQFVFKVLFISICHQFNWDYLQDVMADWLLPAPSTDLARVAQTKAVEISKLLARYPKPERIRPEQRAKMLRRTAQELLQLQKEGRLKSLFLNRKLAGDAGFYETMKSIGAFAEDDLEKKVRVLAHDLYREGILVFRDPENLRPAVEYHILRLYIRSGRVYPIDDAIREHLIGDDDSSRPRLVKLLRQTVEEAMNLTAFYANMDVATLNYVEWQIGRSVCTPDLPPHCETKPIAKLAGDVRTLSPLRCVYSEFCRSFTEPQYGWYHEPRFQKAIY